MTKQTLEELEGNIWPSSDSSSPLTKTVYQLRKKPIEDFSIEDLRIVIGQGEGLQYLMPIAIGKIESNPMIEGDYFPGDLLVSVLSNKAWLIEQKEFLGRLQVICQGLLSGAAGLDKHVYLEVERFLQ